MNLFQQCIMYFIPDIDQLPLGMIIIACTGGCFSAILWVWKKVHARYIAYFCMIIIITSIMSMWLIGFSMQFYLYFVWGFAALCGFACLKKYWDIYCLYRAFRREIHSCNVDDKKLLTDSCALLKRQREMFLYQQRALELSEFRALVNLGALKKAEDFYKKYHRDTCAWFFLEQWRLLAQGRFSEADGIYEKVQQCICKDTTDGEYQLRSQINHGYAMMMMKDYLSAEALFYKLLKNEKICRNEDLLANVYNNLIQCKLHVNLLDMEDGRELLRQYRMDLHLEVLKEANMEIWLTYINDELNVYRQSGASREELSANIIDFFHCVMQLELPIDKRCALMASSARIIQTARLKAQECVDCLLRFEEAFFSLPFEKKYFCLKEIDYFFRQAYLQVELTSQAMKMKRRVEEYLGGKALFDGWSDYRNSLPEEAAYERICALKEQASLYYRCAGDNYRVNVCTNLLDDASRIAMNQVGNPLQACLLQLDAIDEICRPENRKDYKRFVTLVKKRLSKIKKMFDSAPVEAAVFAEGFFRMGFYSALVGNNQDCLEAYSRFKQTGISILFFTPEFRAYYIYCCMAAKAYLIQQSLENILHGVGERLLSEFARECIRNGWLTDGRLISILVGKIIHIDQEDKLYQGRWPSTVKAIRQGVPWCLTKVHYWLCLPMVSIEIDLLHPRMTQGEDSRIVFEANCHPLGLGEAEYAQVDFRNCGIGAPQNRVMIRQVRILDIQMKPEEIKLVQEIYELMEADMDIDVLKADDLMRLIRQSGNMSTGKD